MNDFDRAKAALINSFEDQHGGEYHWSPEEIAWHDKLLAKWEADNANKIRLDSGHSDD